MSRPSDDPQIIYRVQGEPRDEAGRLRVDPETAAQIIMSANVGVALSVVTQPETYSDPELSTQVRDAVHRQLLTPEPDTWTALRHAMDTAIESYRHDPDASLAMTRLVRSTPALAARQLEKQHGRRPALAHALAERAGSPDHPAIGHWVRASAALTCLTVTVDQWSDSDGRLDLVALLDEAFAALANSP